MINAMPGRLRVAVAADPFDITRLSLAAERAARSAEEVGEGLLTP